MYDLLHNAMPGKPNKSLIVLFKMYPLLLVLAILTVCIT